jgi:hypothetical protein
VVNDCSDGTEAKLRVVAEPGNVANVIAGVDTSTSLTAFRTIVGSEPAPENGATVAEVGGSGATIGQFAVAEAAGPFASHTLIGTFYVYRAGSDCQVVVSATAS